MPNAARRRPADAAAASGALRPPRGQRPRGFNNWDGVDGVWRNDDGETPASYRERDAHAARERRASKKKPIDGYALVGRFVHVPLSAWPPHECDSGSCTGLIFKFWANEQRFQVTFSADASEDIALTWAELHGEQRRAPRASLRLSLIHI